MYNHIKCCKIKLYKIAFKKSESLIVSNLQDRHFTKKFTNIINTNESEYNNSYGEFR